MIAIDTNVALRLILADDAQQLELVLQAMERDLLFVSLTVLLETGWALQSRYAFPRSRVADALDALLALDRIEVDKPDLASWSISSYRAGADLADAIHLAAAAKKDSFLTFDQNLKKSGQRCPVPIEVLA